MKAQILRRRALIRSNQFQSLAQVHAAVFLFGMAGIFGKLISVSSSSIVFGRVFFCCLTLGLALLFSKCPLKLDRTTHYYSLGSLGILLAIHWITFFKSIQTSTVAIGLITFSTFSVFVLFIEPLVGSVRFQLSSLFLAGIASIGIFCVIPDFEFKKVATQGALWGIASGFTFALLSVLNRRFVQIYSARIITFYETITASVFLSPVLLAHKEPCTVKNIILLMLLGSVFTAGAHSLFISGMRKVETRNASLIACLEPVYGILIATIVLHEIPTLRVIFGGVLIIGVAIVASLRSSE